MKAKTSVLIVASIIIFVLGNFASVYAAEDQISPQTNWGIDIGFSPYIGIIGLEVQRNAFSISIGPPACIGLRYYMNGAGTRWFCGLHHMRYETENSEADDGIVYDTCENEISGLGFGYKWRWWQHLDLTFNLSIAYHQSNFENIDHYRKEKVAFLFPGLTLGYRF